MKLEIIKGGAIQGWFVSLCITFIVSIFIVMGFLSDTIAARWNTMGQHVSLIYIGQFTAWLGYTILKSKKE